MNLHEIYRHSPKPIKKILKWGYHLIPFKIELFWKRKNRQPFHGRYDYQKRYIDFNIRPSDCVLDIASGGHPFPLATVLMDRYIGETIHRTEPLARDRRPFIVGDIFDIPASDKCFDFVYCSHVLEHVHDPIKACAEIMRVVKRGYIETPTIGKDALFCWAKEYHKWHIVNIKNTLYFFESTPRQREGIRSSLMADYLSSNWYHPFQDIYLNNQDIFNVMFAWNEKFSVLVFRLDGTIEAMNFEMTKRIEKVHHAMVR